MHTNHAPKKAARARARETGQSYAAALADVRAERLAHRERLEDGDRVPEDALTPSAAVPPELPWLVAHHVDVISDYFRGALNHGRIGRNYGDWTRIVLYQLTDALEHLHLLIGTIAAHMQHNHMSPDRIRSYLQVPDQRQVDLFVTQHARRQLAGLLGEPEPDGRDDMGINYRIGRSIAERDGWTEAAREDTLEAFLAALYSTYPGEPTALDHLPEHIRDVAIKASALSLVPREQDDAPDQAPTISKPTI